MLFQPKRIFDILPLKRQERGFTLVEMTVVMLLSGLVLVALVTSYLRWDDLLRSSQTKENLSIVSDALSAYAARNFRIPCPADPANVGPEPFGTERGSGTNGANIGNCNNLAGGDVEGLIPFATLGLDAQVVVDGWGNYFTYQVTPSFTRDPEDDSILVHAKCRTTDWLEGVVNVSGVLDGGRNIAAQKARFCCMQAVVASQANVFSTPAPDNTPSLIFNADANDWYDVVDIIADPNLVDANNPIADSGAQPFYNNDLYGGGIVPVATPVFGHTDQIVYVIISHGKNEAGAFLANGTLNRISGGGTSELINASATNQVVYDILHDDSNDATYYDDIVSWQTQSNLLSRLRRDSCAVP